MPRGGEVGAWKYAFRYEITARHMPELPEQARSIGEAQHAGNCGVVPGLCGCDAEREVVQAVGWRQNWLYEP